MRQLHYIALSRFEVYPSGFDLIPRILRRHRISACIDDLPPKWITQIGDPGASPSDTDKIVLPLTQQKLTSTNYVNRPIV